VENFWEKMWKKIGVEKTWKNVGVEKSVTNFRGKILHI
jgi:hypothetical protein